MVASRVGGSNLTLPEYRSLSTSPWDLICDCGAKLEWGYGRILVRDGANAGWINYMLKDRQKSEFDGFVDCIIIESLHNPIADA